MEMVVVEFTGKISHTHERARAHTHTHPDGCNFAGFVSTRCLLQRKEVAPLNGRDCRWVGSGSS